MEALRDGIGRMLQEVLRPLAHVLARSHVSPNFVTVVGLLVNVLAAYLIVRGDLLLAGIVYLAGGAFDLLDGLLARVSDRVTPAGAFLDSTLDRVSEGVVFAAIAYLFARDGHAADSAIVLLALLGSLLVSYTRARAEALGIACEVGVATRPERVVLVVFGLLTGWLAPVIYLLVALTGITVVQRVRTTLRGLSSQG